MSISQEARGGALCQSWAGTRQHAIARLKEFTVEVPRYSAIRNYALQENEGVSRLSPFVRLRLISEDEIISHVTSSVDFKVAEKFIQEVVWRTYWKGALHQAPWLWHSYEERRATLLTTRDSAPWSLSYDSACTGNTHLSYFNEWVQELTSTGYLHNHVRMWFASIWIFTFSIPWQLGAAFMHHHLLDGDPASNTLSWRWVAGLHTKGKFYLARADNITTYSQGRWTPQEGELATEPFSIHEDPPLTPTPFSTKSLTLPPLQHTTHTGLVVTTDDLSIETILDTQRFRSVCIYHPRHLEETAIKQTFITQAIDDLKTRISTIRGEQAISVLTSPADLLTWCEHNRLDAVQIVAPHVGPLSKHLEQLIALLTPAGLPVGLIQRAWDATLFPLCNKGFFTMWEQFKKRRAVRKDDLAGTCAII